MDFKIFRASENELINGCLRRDRAAQKQLFGLYSAKMYSLCCRYVKDPMEAEDIMLTAFTTVFEKIHQFKREGSFEGWIRRIMVNEALMHLRRNRAMYLEIELEHADRELNYESLTDHLETEDLLKMIEALPTGYRIVFNLYAIDGYTHKEIAEQLGINENTSKSQLSRARIYLQKMLANNDWPHNQKHSKHESAT